MSQPATGCPFCDKKGLPMLPLRPAVARTDISTAIKTLDLPANFQQGITDIALPAGSAKYVSRLLRGGYLYVFNEKRGEWKAYVVTPKSYLYEFDIHDTTPADAQAIEFSCSRTADVFIARCITIPDAASAGRVWLGFSDAAWTPAVLRKHRKRGYREKHMRLVDVGAWVHGTTSLPHAAPFSRLCDVVNEFTKSGPDSPAQAGESADCATHQDADGVLALTTLDEVVVRAYPAFDHSPHAFYGCSHEAEGLLEWATAAAHPHQPMLVSIPDPVGIAAELNELIKKRALLWADQPDRSRKHGSAMLIGAMREAVGRGAEVQESQRRKTTVGVLGAFMPAHMGALGGAPGYRGVANLMDRAGQLEESELTAIHAGAWGKYEEMYDEVARRRYLEHDYPAQLAAFETTTLRPLDDAYLAWLRAEAFRQSFICNFDSTDCESGIAYAQSLHVVLLDASGRRTVSQYLHDCLNQDPGNPDSIEIRSLALNQDALVKQWTTIAANGPKQEDGYFGWDAMAETLYSGFKGALEQAIGGDLSGPFAQLSKHVYELSGPMLRSLNKIFDSATGAVIAQLPEKRVMALLGMVAKSENPGMRLVDLRTEATRQQAVRMVARTVAAASGANEHGLRAGTRQSLDDFFDPLDGRRYPFQGVVLIDEAQAQRLGSMKASEFGSARNKLMTAVVLRPERFSVQMEYSVRRMMNVDLKAGVVSGILAVWSMSSAWEEIRRKPGLQSTTGFASGVAALTSALFETTGAAARATPWGAARLARPMGVVGQQLSTRAASLSFAGRMIGAIGGVISGALAIWEGIDALVADPLYGRSMIILGAGMTIVAALLFFGCISGGIGLVITIVIALIMFVAGYFKKDSIQKWLDRTTDFGHNKAGERFADLDNQLAGMKAITDHGD